MATEMDERFDRSERFSSVRVGTFPGSVKIQIDRPQCVWTLRSRRGRKVRESQRRRRRGDARACVTEPTAVQVGGTGLSGYEGDFELK